MNIRENIEKNRKDVLVIGKLGIVLMSIGLIPFLIINPFRGIPSSMIEHPFIGIVNVVLGFVLLLISLLLCLCSFLKQVKNEKKGYS